MAGRRFNAAILLLLVATATFRVAAAAAPGANFSAPHSRSVCAGHHKLKSIYRHTSERWCDALDTRSGAAVSRAALLSSRLEKRAGQWWDQIDSFLGRRRTARREQARVRGADGTGFNATVVVTAVLGQPASSARYVGCILSHLDYVLQWGYDLRIYREARPLSSDDWVAKYVESACGRDTFLDGIAGPSEGCRMEAFDNVLVFRTMWIAKAMHEILLVDPQPREVSPHYIMYLDLDAYVVNSDEFPVRRMITDAEAACQPRPGLGPPLVVAQHQGCTVNTGFMLFRASRTVLDEIIPLWIREYGAFSERHKYEKVNSWSGDQGAFMNAILRTQRSSNGECGSTKLHYNTDRNRCFKKKLKPRGSAAGPICLLPVHAPYNNHDCASEYHHGDFVHHRTGVSKCLEAAALRGAFCQRHQRCRTGLWGTADGTDDDGLPR